MGVTEYPEIAAGVSSGAIRVPARSREVYQVE
jgi:hypothetical protein